MLEWLLIGVLLAWIATIELRFWRSYRAIMILDTIIKALTRYARERGE